MAAKLKLVVDNTNVKDKIVASIKPLDAEIAPSEDFRQRMKLRLLKMSENDGARAA